MVSAFSECYVQSTAHLKLPPYIYLGPFLCRLAVHLSAAVFQTARTAVAAAAPAAPAAVPPLCPPATRQAATTLPPTQVALSSVPVAPTSTALATRPPPAAQQQPPRSSASETGRSTIRPPLPTPPAAPGVRGVTARSRATATFTPAFLRPRPPSLYCLPPCQREPPPRHHHHSLPHHRPLRPRVPP